MRNLVRLVGVTLAGLAAVGVLGIGHALAQQQHTVTKSPGSTSGSGTWTRTITDVTEPNGPDGGTIQSIYNITVPWTPSMSAQQIATAYKNAAIAALPAANAANGYTVVVENLAVPTVRVTKQTGTYNFGDATPPTGISLTTNTALTAEDAPIASPVGLASLAASLLALGYWNRRRRKSA